MAKCSTIAAFVLCFSSVLISAYAEDALAVEGLVYCDPCRVGFQTPLSKGIPALVQLKCKNRETGKRTIVVEDKTDEEGIYHLPVEGDHEEEICEVSLVESYRPNCTDPFTSIDSARVLLTKNVGVVQNVRYANALGFMTKKAQPECAQVLQDMGFLPLEDKIN